MWITLAMAVVVSAEGDAVKLKVGDEAPAFSLPASNGKTVSLAEFKGRKKVVLAFYPKAFTGG
jgi:peroxiredoxin Q/BCP